MVFTSATLSENIRVQPVALLNQHPAAAIGVDAQDEHPRRKVREPDFIAVRGPVRAGAERPFLTNRSRDMAEAKAPALAVSATPAAFDPPAAFGDAGAAAPFPEISRGLRRQIRPVEVHIDPSQ